MQPSTPTKKKTQRKIGKEAAGKQAAPKVPPVLSQGTTANPSTRNIPDLENVIGTSYSLAVSPPTIHADPPKLWATRCP